MTIKNISYSLTPSIQTNIQTVELIKRDILCTSLSPKTERRARFDTLVARIHAIVMLGGMEQTKNDVLTLLTASPAKQPEHSPVLALKKTLSYIWEEWTMNPRSVSYGSVERLALELGETPRIGTILMSELSHHKESIQQLLTFLDTTKDHPVITAFVAFLELVNIGPLGSKTTQLALCVMFMYLHKYGYDLRGMVSLIPSWTGDMRTFGDTMRVSHSTGNFSTFIDFALQRYVSELEDIKTHLTSDQLRFSVPATLVSLSDRQKEILSLLDDPTNAITNRVIQKRFNISQITASRELTKLTNLGLLYPHGKGRSVSYTKA